VGLILDLAVVALALVVIGSLALLAWTLGVNAVRSVRRGRESVAEARRSAAESEVRLVAGAEQVRSTLEQLTRRTAPMTPEPTQPTPTPPPTPPPPPGEQPDV
jgi:glycine/D-amino acid oxidase-like deaminating enzyme